MSIFMIILSCFFFTESENDVQLVDLTIVLSLFRRFLKNLRREGIEIKKFIKSLWSFFEETYESEYKSNNLPIWDHLPSDFLWKIQIFDYVIFLSVLCSQNWKHIFDWVPFCKTNKNSNRPPVLAFKRPFLAFRCPT